MRERREKLSENNLFFWAGDDKNLFRSSYREWSAMKWKADLLVYVLKRRIKTKKKVVCCLRRPGRWAFPLLTWMMCTLTPSLRLVNFKFKDEFQFFLLFQLKPHSRVLLVSWIMNFSAIFFRLNMRIPLLRMEFVLLVEMWILDEPKMLNFIEVSLPRLRWSMQNILKMLKLTNITSPTATSDKLVGSSPPDKVLINRREAKEKWKRIVASSIWAFISLCPTNIKCVLWFFMKIFLLCCFIMWNVVEWAKIARNISSRAFHRKVHKSHSVRSSQFANAFWLIVCFLCFLLFFAQVERPSSFFVSAMPRFWWRKWNICWLSRVGEVLRSSTIKAARMLSTTVDSEKSGPH